MAKVIVLDNIAQEGLDLLDAAEGIEYDVRTGLKGEELRLALNEYEGAICRSGVTITPESLEGNRSMRAIVRAGVGTDNIDKPSATRHGIVVMNTPTGNTVSTAEHAFSLMLGMSRNIAPANQSLIEGRWDRKKFMGTQLAGKTLGIVGLGRIGQELAKRAQAFEMKVVGYDPFLSAEQAAKLGIELFDSVHDFLPSIDYLSVHTPLTPETKNLISTKEIEMLKPTARLVNCARGGIYDEAALVQGLKDGQFAGVALDVYPEEPCKENPLFGMDGVLCTPHLGASTEEAQTQVAVEAVHLVTNYLTTGEVRHAVNTASIDPNTLNALRGYIDVAYRLGMLMAQWHESSIESAQLSYRGEIVEHDTKMLTSAFCAGLLGTALDEEVNIVNAEVLCKERGIKLTEQSNGDPGAFSSSVTVEVEGAQKKYFAGGTLFGNNMPRLFCLGDFRLEAYLDGSMFIFTHQDVPGIVGTIGTVLGKHQVNIGQMSVGRTGTAQGGQAIGVLNLDSSAPQAALKEILQVDGVDTVQQIQMPSAGELPSWLQ